MRELGCAARQNFADAVQVAFAAGAGIMLVAFLIALAFMPAGRETATE
jgi:hypothetical protein